MIRSVTELQNYLYATLGLEVRIHAWKNQRDLPAFLSNNFAFYEGPILEHPCLFMIGLEANCFTPGTIRKYWEQVRVRYTGFTIYVQARVSASDRQRLIGYKVPFLVPGNQLYLPELGIDLREYFKSYRVKESKYLSPAAQTVMISALLGKIDGKFTASSLAEPLGFSPMTISRVFDELIAAEIGEIEWIGKERRWRSTGSKQDLWKQVKQSMRSPVKGITWLKQQTAFATPTILAGLSALSHYSFLNPPNLPVYAIDKETYKNWKNSGIDESPYVEESICELQIWYYNPALFSDNNVVDPFSLYLSLIQSNDERVESALEEMLGKIRW